MPRAEPAAPARPVVARPTWRDVTAGLVTGLFSIPEGMAYASIGGFAAPLGLWSGAVPTIVGSVLARTALMVTTLTSAIALTSQSVLASAGLPADDLGAIATMTVLVGVAMLALGLLRLGSVMAYVSTAVMTGFTTGIAVQILAGVVKDATGYSPESTNTVGKLVGAVLHVLQWDLTTTLVALATVGVWFVVRLVRALRPFATLIAMVAVSVSATLAPLRVELVGDIAPVPRSLPPFTLPDPSAVPALAAGAGAIALVALAQAAGISAAVANPDGSRGDASTDFRAQGAANMIGGFFGALPTGGSLSRTGVATSAGAGSRWAGIFAGAWLALIVLAVGPVASLIPMAVIGGLMLVIGGELVSGRLADIRLVMRTSPASAAAMIVTFLATTALPLQQAIFLGAGLSILLSAVQIRRAGRLVQLVRGDGPGWVIDEPPSRLPSHQTTVLHYTGVGFFAEFNNLDQEWPDTAGAIDAALVISTRGSLSIPSATFLSMLARKAEEMQGHGVGLVVCGVPARMRELLARTGSLDRLGEQNVIAETPEVFGSLRLAYERAEKLRERLRAEPS